MKLTNAYKQQLASQTLFLDAHHNKVTFKQRKWHIDNNIYILVTCTTCNNLVRWDTKTNIYRRFCSSKCAHSNIDVVTKTMNTCIERFGVSTNLKTEATKEKIKLTNLSRYGVDNFAKSSEFVKKVQTIVLK